LSSRVGLHGRGLHFHSEGVVVVVVVVIVIVVVVVVVEIDIVQNIIKDYTHLANSGKVIILCWIPSHVNIYGNERADTAAKSALSLPITNIKLPARALIPCVSKFSLDEWQDIWDCCEVINFILFTPLLASSSIAKIFPAMIPSCSTDCKLVILISLTHTY